jgi:hypothetical protein
MEEAQPHRITVENRLALFIYAGPVNNCDKSYKQIYFKEKATFSITPQDGIAYMHISVPNYQPSSITIGICVMSLFTTIMK